MQRLGMAPKWVLALVLAALAFLGLVCGAVDGEITCGNQVYMCNRTTGVMDIRTVKRYHLPDWYVAREETEHYDDSAVDPASARFYQR